MCLLIAHTPSRWYAAVTTAALGGVSLRPLGALPLADEAGEDDLTVALLPVVQAHLRHLRLHVHGAPSGLHGGLVAADIILYRCAGRG